MFDVDRAMRERRSVRGFFPDRLVPAEHVQEALELAQCAPSNCNVQPWRVFVASGAGCGRLRQALTSAIESGDVGGMEDEMDRFHEPYRKLQVECAVALYREMGIERNDHGARMQATLRNFQFFNAPHVAIVCMDKAFGVGVAVDVGMWVQNFMLALWARGVGSCAQASLRQYPLILRRELQIPESLRILCGVSFGYEDNSVPANRCRQTREPLAANVRVFTE